MKTALRCLTAAALLVAGASLAAAAPYEGYGDYHRSAEAQGRGQDGEGYPGLPGGRGGRSGLELAREQSRPAAPRADEARLRRFCSDLLRRRPGKPVTGGFRPSDCEELFARLDRDWPAPRSAQGLPGQPGGTGSGPARDGAPGPSVSGGQGGEGGAAGVGAGAGSGGNGGAGVAGGRGGQGGGGGGSF